MTREELDRLWDKVRDGEASAEERRAFDEHMMRDPEMAALWGAETRWLTALGEKQTPKGRVNDGAFTQRVLDQYDLERRRRVFPVIDWRKAGYAGGWAAAVIAIAAVMWFSDPREPARPDRVASVPPPLPAPMQIDPDPMSVLVSDMTEQIQMRPARMYNTVRDTHSLFSVRNAFDLLGGEPMPRQPRERD